MKGVTVSHLVGILEGIEEAAAKKAIPLFENYLPEQGDTDRKD